MQRCSRMLSSGIWRRCGLPPLGCGAVTELINLRSFGSRPYSADAHAQEPEYPCHRARLLDGRAVAAQWQDELAREVASMRARGLRRPGLGVVLVGERPDSALYVARKQEACSRVGIYSEMCHLPANSSQQEVQDAVTALCRNPAIDGVLVQLPLPRHIDEEAIIESFDPAKDVDGFHPLNIGRILMRGRAAHFVPCTALGCIQLLERSGVDMKGKSVVVMGDSNIVGMPLAMLFRDSGAATVTVIHRTSYRELFQDSYNYEQRALQRAQAEACLPRLPGLLSRHTPQGGPQPQEHHPSASQQQDAAAAAAHPHQPYKISYASQMQGAYASSLSDSEEGSRRRRHDADHRRRHRQPPQQPHGEQPQPAAAALTALDDGDRDDCMHLEDLPGITRTADILVVAVGFPRLVRAHWLKPGAVVIDVGINVVDGEEEASGSGTSGDGGGAGGSASGAKWPHATSHNSGHSHPPQQHPQHLPGSGAAFHVVGDVDFGGVLEVASAVTPVPGGVGPMTISALLHNTVQAAKHTLRAEGAGE